MRVLVVDDDARLRSFLRRGLEDSGLSVVLAASAELARKEIASAEAPFDLFLLDITMPGTDGLEFLRELRARGDATPALFLTARQAVEDRVQGLELGADDYIVKPFALEELLARIRAVLRRREAAPLLAAGPLRLDPARLVVLHGSNRVELSPKEFGLFATLFEARGRAVSRKALLDAVWGIGFNPGTNLVDVTIGRLRKRIHATGPARIETEVGVGYRLDLGGTSPP